MEKKSPFTCGQKVLLRSVNRKGVIVERAGKSAWKVAVGSVTFTRPAADLEPLAKEKEKKLPRYLAEPKVKVVCEKKPARLKEVDLHGLNVSQALSVVESALSDAVLSGSAELTFVHGLGSGRLKSALHDFLGRQKVVRHFSLAQLNPGATKVYL